MKHWILHNYVDFGKEIIGGILLIVVLPLCQKIINTAIKIFQEEDKQTP